MTHDESLAERVRDVLAPRTEYDELLATWVDDGVRYALSPPPKARKRARPQYG